MTMNLMNCKEDTQMILKPEEMSSLLVQRKTYPASFQDRI